MIVFLSFLFSRLIGKFENDGCLVDAHFSRPRTPTKRTQENIEAVSGILSRDPSTSTRKVALEAGLSHGTTRRIMREDLGVFPYKIQLGQPLPSNAPERRLNFANELLTRLESGEIDLKKIWFSDECHFWLGGYVNRQNYRIWGTQRPELVTVRPLNPQKITVWAAMNA